MMIDRIKHFACEPLVHFLVIGACVYATFALFGEKPEQEPGAETIRVTAGEVAWMVDSWTTKWGRPPTEQELLGMIRDRIRETAYYREALAMGLDKDDVIIRRRLTQKLEFLTEDLATAEPPTDEELKAYFNEHRDKYREPDSITFTHVFLDPDKRGDATLDDAKEIKAQLIAMGKAALNQGEPIGDRFMLQNYYPERTKAEISKLFGRGFAQSLFELEAGDWQGPVLSGYGTHIVLVHALVKSPDAEFDSVRERVLEDCTAKKREEFNRKFTEGVLSRYDVIVELEDDAGNVEEISVGMGKQDADNDEARGVRAGERMIASRAGEDE